eukprot:11192374-Lingulodinium_polyedra.AAC.1
MRALCAEVFGLSDAAGALECPQFAKRGCAGARGTSCICRFLPPRWPRGCHEEAPALRTPGLEDGRSASW